MFKNIKYIAVIFISLLSIMSCKDFLDKEPKFSLTPSTAFSDSTGLQGLLTSAYRTLHQFDYYGQRMMVLGDMLADNGDIANQTQRYVSERANEPFSHALHWNEAYTAINDVNLVLSNVDKPEIIMTDVTRSRLKAQALFIRALCYHDLLRAYSYEPGREQNGFNLGVPLRITPVDELSDVGLPARATNSEVYDRVITDLNDAIQIFESLPASARSTSFPFLATLSSTQALRARVQLYAGNYAEAASSAQAALGSTTAILVTTGAVALNESYAAQPHPESLFELNIIATDWNAVDGVNNSLASLTNQITGGNFSITASDELIAAYPSGDFRGNGPANTTNRLWAFVAGVGDATTYRCLKWRGEKGVGGALENIPVIRYSEVLLTLAEALARTNNEAGALRELNKLRAARGLTSATFSGEALINDILLQRRLELAFEGHRFFDLKRLGLPIPKPIEVGPALQPSDFRILAPIPLSQVTINPNLEQNPGY